MLSLPLVPLMVERFLPRAQWTGFKSYRHVTVYHKRVRDGHVFLFAAGNYFRHRLPSKLEGASPVSVAKVRQVVQSRDPYGMPVLGTIAYDLRQTDKGLLATSDVYQPRRNARRFTKALGLFLEFQAVQHLRRQQGVRYISTTSDPSARRMRQVIALGLPIGEPVPIGTWLTCLRAGLRQ